MANVIAIICDCDGTLCPDTSVKLTTYLGMTPTDFWQREVPVLVEQGWDPPLAYLNLLIRKASQEQQHPITRQLLRDVAAEVQFYPGALDFVDRLRDKLNEVQEFREADIILEWYVVSGGIEELLQATTLQERATDVFGCSLEFDQAGKAVGVKRSVTFTEKTKFIYAINKGITGEQLRRRPYRVNDAIEQDRRRIPFDQMVYIGDGPSDIPCFSMIKANKGEAIGVMAPEDVELKKPYELAQGDRLTIGPYTANYEDGSDLLKMLWKITEGIAVKILVKQAQSVRAAPQH